MSLFADKDIDRRFSRTQWRMLFATMIGYTLFYFMRKNFSFAMPGLEQDCGISKAMLGNFLFAGGIVYGISKFLNGIVGDRCNSRKMLCFGLLVCSLVNVAFGFAPQIAAWFTGGAEVPSYMTALAWTFGALLVLNQFFQGTGFPPCAKLIAFWVPPNELATKMSVWNTSHSIGGGLVAKVCGIIMGLGVIGAANQGVGMWRWCFWSMAILGLLGLVAMWLTLPGTPKEEGLPDLPGTETGGARACATEKETADAQKRISSANAPSMARMVFLNPVIWMLGLCNFGINATRALVADWGPTLLAGGERPHLQRGGNGDHALRVCGHRRHAVRGMGHGQALWRTRPAPLRVPDGAHGGIAGGVLVPAGGRLDGAARDGCALHGGLLPVRPAGPHGRNGHEHVHEGVRRHVDRLHLALLVHRRLGEREGVRFARAELARLASAVDVHHRRRGDKLCAVPMPLERARQQLREEVGAGIKNRRVPALCAPHWGLARRA